MFRSRAALIVLSLLVLSSTFLWSQSEAELEWTKKHYSDVVDKLFPLNQRVGTFVAYRSRQEDGRVPEYSFLIGWERSDRTPGLNAYLTAHVRLADSTSLSSQIMSLHRLRPNASFEDIQGELHVKRWTFTEMNCPAVKSQFELFQALHITTPEFGVIVFHPLYHEFHVRAGTGDMDIVFYDDKNPLVKWALDTRKALEACAKSAH